MSEMDKLEEFLKKNEYQYDRKIRFELEQIVVYQNGERKWDAISGCVSYGGEQGLLEVMGAPVVLPEDGDTVRGWLTAQDVIDRLKQSGTDADNG